MQLFCRSLFCRVCRSTPVGFDRLERRASSTYDETKVASSTSGQLHEVKAELYGINSPK